jgi:hypothetical protein
MKASQAAKEIGCSHGYLRAMISMGRIIATQIDNTNGKIWWDVDPSEVERFKSLKIKSRGVVRGSKKVKT